MSSGTLSCLPKLFTLIAAQLEYHAVSDAFADLAGRGIVFAKGMAWGAGP